MVGPDKPDGDEPEAEEKKADDAAADTDYVKVVDKAFVTLRVPQQKNGYDCGMYVVEFTGFLANDVVQGLLRSEKEEEDVEYPSVADVSLFGKKVQFNSKYMLAMRKKWRKTIDEMHKQQKSEK